jgi:hypothetical protein
MEVQVLAEVEEVVPMVQLQLEVPAQTVARDLLSYKHFKKKRKDDIKLCSKSK